MNAAQCTDAVTAYLAKRVRGSVGDLANSVEVDVRHSISIPDGGTPARPIHSKPGEPPRRESGDYRGSWTSTVSESGDRITGTAGTTSNLGPMLEFGTGKMAARPHAKPAYERLRESAADRIKSNL